MEFLRLPEAALMLGVLVILLSATCAPKLSKLSKLSKGKEGEEWQGGCIAFRVTQITLWTAFFCLLWQGRSHETLSIHDATIQVFNHPLTRILQGTVLIVTSAALFYAKGSLVKDQLWKPETFALLLSSVIGALTVISANHFLPLFLGVELMSLPLYAMIALRPDPHAIEAGLKYFFLGALSTAILLYALSMAYGTSGSLTALLSYQEEAKSIDLTRLAYFFLIAAIAFKLSLVPFHMWAPDVYQGAPTFLTFFISSVPKLAAVMLLFRFSVGAFTESALMALSLLSMVVGAVAAIIQTDIKRMLAYSTIGHMGYLLLGMVALDEQGYSASFVYLLTYVVTGLAAFGVLLIAEATDKPLRTLSDLIAFAKRSPVLAWVMAGAMLSYAGVPPFIGFFAKFAVIESVLNSGHSFALTLSVVAILTSVIAAFYYLRVIALMFFVTAENESTATPRVGFFSSRYAERALSKEESSDSVLPTDGILVGRLFIGKTLLIANGAVLLILGIAPDNLFTTLVAIVENALGLW